MAPTIDQLIAARIGQDNVLPSLEVCVGDDEPERRVRDGRRCYYSSTLSFRNATTPLPMEFNPRKVFVQLFGEGDTPEERATISHRRASLLDLIDGRVPTRCKATLGARDRVVLDDYLETVREIGAARREGLAARSVGREPARHADRGAAGHFDEQVKLDVRPDRARVPGRPHARGVVHHGGRRHEPHLQPHRRVGRLPSAVASRTTWSASRSW